MQSRTGKAVLRTIYGLRGVSVPKRMGGRKILACSVALRTCDLLPW